MIIVKAGKALCTMASKKAGQIKNSKLYNTVAMRLMTGKNGFGMNEILGIAAGIVIAALIVVPGLKTFTNGIMTKLNEWWGDVKDVFFGI